MKCYNCGKQYEGNECPRCALPAIEVPNATWEEGRQALEATIAPFRASFLQAIELSLVLYWYRDENGSYVLDHEELLPLGTGTELLGQERWLDRELARLDSPTITVRLRLSVRGRVREEQVEIPNLQAAELQNIGVAMDEAFRIRLMLRNTSEKPTCSAPVEV